MYALYVHAYTLYSYEYGMYALRALVATCQCFCLPCLDAASALMPFPYSKLHAVPLGPASNSRAHTFVAIRTVLL